MILRILIPIFILAVGVGAWKWLGIPVAPPAPEPRPPQRLKTEYLELSKSQFPVILQSQGTIRAHHTTTLTAQVSGIIRVIHPSFEDGAFFQEGDVLAELDAADLEAEQISAQASLARAEASLAQEEARAKQARLNWEDMGYQEEPSPLVLRVPQLKEANANVVAAMATLAQADRNLERTKIRAPFAGRVKSRLVGLGQSVSSTTPLGEIFATDFAEVRLPLTPDQLQFIRLPTREEDAPVPVTLIDALGSPATGEKPTWKAHIVRTEGSLDETSRELFAIARIVDPFGIETGMPELRIGQPVRASIEGMVLQDVYVIPRSSLRGINRVYLVDQQNPSIIRTQISPIWSTAEVLVVRDGIEQGDWLAVSRLPYAPNGAPVEVVDSKPLPDSLGQKEVTSPIEGS